MTALPEVITWSTGQLGYSHCFWCWRELRLGDWMWGCTDCHDWNLRTASAFRQGQAERVKSLKELLREVFDDPAAWRPSWTPAYDVVPREFAG